MRCSEVLPDLVSTCRGAAAQLMSDFEAAPQRSGFSEVGLVAEMAVLGDGILQAAPLVQLFSDAAARWLRSGLIEEFCFARADLACHAALLAYMARRGAGFHPDHMRVLKGLCEGRLIGRSEIPVLTQRLLAAYFNRCGIDTDFGEPGRRDLAAMVDKRVLRPRSDEHDVGMSIVFAQLLHLDPGSIGVRPRLFPQVLLTQAVRSANLNWTPVLAFLCERWFSMEEGLRAAAQRRMIENLPPHGTLLPPPPPSGSEGDQITRTARGLRIRSTIALVYSLCTLGDLHGRN